MTPTRVSRWGHSSGGPSHRAKVRICTDHPLSGTPSTPGYLSPSSHIGATVSRFSPGVKTGFVPSWHQPSQKNGAFHGPCIRLASLVGTLPAGGSFCSVKRNQNPLRAFPPNDPPWGTRQKLCQAYVRPVTLAVAPITATTPSYPGQLALWLGGFHVRAYHGEAAFPPPGVLLHHPVALR